MTTHLQPCDVQLVQRVAADITAGKRRSGGHGASFWDIRVGGRSTGSSSRTLADRWPMIGPLLCEDPSTTTWHRLPRIRTMIRGWQQFVPDDLLPAWDEYLRETGIMPPEWAAERPRPDWDRSRRKRALDRLATALAPHLCTETGPGPTPEQRAVTTSGYTYYVTLRPDPRGQLPHGHSASEVAEAVMAAVTKAARLQPQVVGHDLDAVLTPRARPVLIRSLDAWTAGQVTPVRRYVGERLVELARSDTTVPALAEVLARGEKAAVWHRAAYYLGKRDEGAEAPELAPYDYDTPALRAAARVAATWCELGSPDLAIRSQADPEQRVREELVELWDSSREARADDEYAWRQLAARLELAHFDLNARHLISRRADEWPLPAATVIDRLVGRVALQVNAGQSVQQLAGHTSRQRPRVIVPAPPQPSGARSGYSRSPGPVQSTLPAGLLDRLAEVPIRPTDGHLPELRDPRLAHAVVTELRTGRYAKKADATHGLTHVITNALVDDRRDDYEWEQQLMRVVNSSMWDMVNSKDQFVPPLVDALQWKFKLPHSPFVATLSRCRATLATKRNSHLEADHHITEALRYVSAADTLASRNGLGVQAPEFEANVLESLQQIVLQQAGARVRSLEDLLTTKRNAAQRADRQKFSQMLLDIAWETERTYRRANQILEKIEVRHGLPQRPEPGRVSVASWRFNTRQQWIRSQLTLALVIRGNLKYRSALDRPPDDLREERVQELLAGAATVYREATRITTTTPQMKTLTQAALLYAFLSGGDFLPPHEKAALPAHLARPMAKDDVTGDRPRALFHVEMASAYLAGGANERSYDAGVLASLTWADGIEAFYVVDERLYHVWRLRWDPQAEVALRWARAAPLLAARATRPLRGHAEGDLTKQRAL